MKRIAVVGGGVIGLATAWQLSRRGAHPIVIDAGRLGRGCSQGNAGWICPTISTPLPSPDLNSRSLLEMLRPGSPLYVKPSTVPSLRPWLKRFRSHCREADYQHGLGALASLNAHTFRLMQEWEDEGLDFEWHRQGLLMVFRDPDKLAAAETEVARTADLVGSGWRRVEREELTDLEPALNDGPRGGLLLQDEGHVRPESLAKAFRADLLERDVELRENEPVTGFRWDGSRATAVETARSTILVDAVLLTAGAETGTLAAACEWSVPMTAGKGYSVTYPNSPRMPRRPLYLADAKVAVTPFAGGLRAAGTMELSGINQELDSRRLKSVRKAVARDLNVGLDDATVESGGTEWVGMRPMVPDTLPVMGAVPGKPNVFVSSGHQMLGMTLSAASGWAMAGLILEGRAPLDLTPFSPARF